MTSNPLAPAWLRVPDDANALVPDVWPASARRNDAGELTIGGITATELAREYGTPLYVLDEDVTRERARRIRETFTRAFAPLGTEPAVYYAGKAFLSTEIARWVTEEGLRLDVASGGELAVALAAGVDPHRLGFHGNNKSLAELDRAVSVGVGSVILDSWEEIDRLADAARRHGVTQAVRLRTTTGVHAHTHDYLATAREDQKFGIPLADVPAHVAHIRSRPELEFLGLHSHIGSQIFTSDGFVEALHRLLAVHAELLRGGPVPELNLGGGYGIAYTSAERAPDIDVIATELAAALGAGAARHGIPVPHLAIEPGRWIVGPAGVTLYEVGTVKDVTLLPEGTTEPAVRRYVAVDGGMSDNVRPALYDADYTVRLAGRTSRESPVLVRVVGKHCESGDIVVHADYLPGDVAPGDLLAVPATGAYCWSLASNYNYLTRPPVVAVTHARARVIVRGETEADLLARDAGMHKGAR